MDDFSHLKWISYAGRLDRLSWLISS